MFSETVDDNWESSSFQDAFIKDYFGGAESSRKKHKKKAKKRSSASEISDTSIVIEDFSSPKKMKIQETTTNKKKIITKDVKVLFKSKDIISDTSKKIKEKLSKSSFASDSSMKKKTKKSKRKKSKNIPPVETSDANLTQSPQTEYSVLSDSGESVGHFSPVKKNQIQSKARQKLQAAKFRYLNELLYTNTGKFSFEYFHENCDEFQDYHEGYQSQVAKWPMNPVDVIIKDLKKNKNLSVIADLGCGEAKISEVFPDRTVHSFDLISLKENVVTCDMANVPLPGESVDAAIFCLSLMGTNWKEYLLEGHRILKMGGFLKIAEIESRIEDMNGFKKCIEQSGFQFISENLSHKMFIFLNFQKVKRTVKASKVKAVSLKPCLYKKR